MISNSLKCIGIHIILSIVTLLIVVLFSIDFDSGRENLLILLISVLYIICGLVFFKNDMNIIKTVAIFLLYIIILSAILSIADNAAMFLLILNPIGLMSMSHISDFFNFEIPMTVSNISASVFPVLLIWLGMLIKKMFSKKNAYDNTE